MSIDSIAIVDCHHHLWNLDENYYPWLTDRITQRVCGEYSAIRKNYLLEDFKRDMGTLNVIKSVHIQAEHDFNDPVRETAWLSEIAASHDAGYPNAIVAWADLADKNASAILQQHCRFKNVRGIRQMCHEAFIPSSSSSTGSSTTNKPIPMQDPNWQRGLKLLAQHKLLFELQFYYPQVDDAFATISANPAIQFVITHTGQPADRTVEGLEQWRKVLKKLSQLPNCVLKISGLGMFDRHWTPESLRPIILDAIDIFQPQRCMFGSNFPVDGMMSSYRCLWEAYYHVVSDFSDVEKSAMFSDNASKIYRL